MLWVYLPVPLQAHVQAQFQAPTDAELKMTSDAKAPGADAVILEWDETSDAAAWEYTSYRRIKVLKEKGKELGTVRYRWDPAAGSGTKFEVEARTVHADGTIVVMTEQPVVLTDVRWAGQDSGSLVFSLPGIEIGSILEYRVRIQRGQMEWSWVVQGEHFVRKALIRARPHFSNVTFSGHLGSAATPVRGRDGFYAVEFHDVPPLPQEDWMPPVDSFRWQIQFYSEEIKDPRKYWTTVAGNWAYGVKRYTKPNGELKKAVDGLVTSKDGEEQKARKIYGAVQGLDNTNFSRVKSAVELKRAKLKEVQGIEDVWKQKSGNSDQIALLFVAMARAAGLDVRVAQVVNRNRAIWDMGLLDVDQLDDFLAVVTVNGKDVLLDPGERYCPFGSLHWKHTVATGFLETDKGAKVWTTPQVPFHEAVVEREADLTLSAEGLVEGTVRFRMKGPEALRWRQLTLVEDAGEVRKDFDDWLRTFLPAGVEASLDRFDGLEDANLPLVAEVKVSGELGTVTGKRFVLPELFFEAAMRHPFVALEKRQTAVDLEYPVTEADAVTYRLPQGMGLESESFVSGAEVTWPGFAVMRIEPKVVAGTVEVRRNLVMNLTLLAAESYPELHGFYQKVATADQEQLVLVAVPAGKSGSE